MRTRHPARQGGYNLLELMVTLVIASMVLGIGIAGAILTTYAAVDAANSIFLAIPAGFLTAAVMALGAGVAAAARGRA